MKATGIVRKVDQLGRIVVPKELRKTMGIDIGSPLEIYVEDDRVIVRKYEPSIKTCMVTGESSEEHLQLANGNVVLSQEAAKQLLDELKQKRAVLSGTLNRTAWTIEAACQTVERMRMRLAQYVHRQWHSSLEYMQTTKYSSVVYRLKGHRLLPMPFFLL